MEFWNKKPPSVVDARTPAELLRAYGGDRGSPAYVAIGELCHKYAENPPPSSLRKWGITGVATLLGTQLTSAALTHSAGNTALFISTKLFSTGALATLKM
jgi:hypothetical protein